MAKKNIPVYKRTLFSWLWETSIKLQILLLIVVIVTVFARVVPLEMQKRIVNDAVGLKNLDKLYIYCGIYLAAVLLSTVLKYVINLLQVVIGQTALSQMRKKLYAHMLTLPINFYRKTQPGMVVNALISEIATAGDFLGMAVAIPITNVLTLLAFGAYLFWLNPLIAAVSMAAYPAVLFLVPLLQRKTNQWNRRRVDATRDMSSKIGESITGIHEIHGNGSYRLENRKFKSLVDKLLHIRIIWNMYRYGVKVLNNFINNLSPFFIFILGGYLTIKGNLELGSLVAFLGAQEKLNDPWKELMDFYQASQESKVRYYRTMEYFDSAPEHTLETAERNPYDLSGEVDIKDLSFYTETGISLLSDVNLDLAPGEHMALVGFSGSGKSTLALCVGQLYKYSNGRALLGGKDIEDLTKQDMTKNVGFVSQSPFIFTGTVRENLVYGLAAMAESIGEDVDAGVGMPSRDDMIEVLQQTGIFVDVLRFGLNTVLPKDSDGELVDKVIRVRKDFQDAYGEKLAKYVEFFKNDSYLYHSSVSENLIFGAPADDKFELDKLAENEDFLEFLGEAQLTMPLLALGAELATQTVDILGNLSLDDVFFEQSPIHALELESFKPLVQRLQKQKLHSLEEADRHKLLELALRFVPGQHKMASLPKMLETLILEGRALFMEQANKKHPDAIQFYREDRYIHSQTILNNILYGKTKTEQSEATDKINQSIIALLVAEDFLEQIVEIGMEFNVGSKGDRLSGGQRQKLAIARTFLKKPPLLIMDEATSALDNKSQARIQNLLEKRFKGHTTVIAVVHRLDIIKNYDKVAVMKAGKIVEVGPYDELMEKKGMLYELVQGKR